MNIDDKLFKVLDSGISNKKLSEISGVDYANISRLRNRKKSVDRLSLATVKKLLKVADQLDDSTIKQK